MSKIIFTQSTPYAIETSHIEVALPGNKMTASINSLDLRLTA